MVRIPVLGGLGRMITKNIPPQMPLENLAGPHQQPLPFPLTPLHFHHFRAPSLPRRSTQARLWTPPFDAPCQWV